MSDFMHMTTKKLNKETAKKKEYLSYYEGMMKQRKMPMTAAQHAKSGREPVYFKNRTKPTVESQLEQAGLSQKEINKLKRKK